MIPWPLVGCTDGNPLEGGYSYLEWSKEGGVWHPGVDLNAGNGGDADCGSGIMAPCDGRIIWAGTTPGYGYGNHVWFKPNQIDDMLHLAHMGILDVSAGQRVTTYTPMGTCGKSGGQDKCHCHTEVWRGAEAPPRWDYWPTGKTRDQVAALYKDPVQWLKDLKPDGEPVMIVDDVVLTQEEIAYFGQPPWGVPINPTALIVRRAALARRRDENPGPFITDEYLNVDGHTRQKCTNTTWDYDGTVVNRVELNLEGV